MGELAEPGAEPVPVRVVYAAVDASRPVAAGLLESLDEQERARAERFRFDADRAIYCHAHALLRLELSELLGAPPASHRFEAGRHGKPRLLGAPAGLDFNLSHTRGMVAVALCEHGDVGVDVEHVARRTDVEAVGRRVLTASEQRSLAGLVGSARSDRFFTYWTLKEAYMKCLGLGFALPAGSFELQAVGTRGYRIQHLDRARPEPGLSLHADRIDDHRLAVVAARPSASFHCLARSLPA